MDYYILSDNDKEFFIEINKDTFRTRIEFNWIPEENFKGVAVGCNYNFKGHPVGFLKDNGIVKRLIEGKKNRAIFTIKETDTIIQAGPRLIKDFEPVKDYRSEGFASHDILSGLHCHIGKKKSGNYLVGFTENFTFNQIINKYQDLRAEEAIKLPGLKSCSYVFKSRVQNIQYGVIPIPVALIFEPRLNKVGDFFSDVSEPI